MKKFIFMLIILFSASCSKNEVSNANESEIENSKFYLLSGDISGENASMYLYVNEDKKALSGYYYTKDKKHMISGKINNKKINMQEIDENNNIHADIVGTLSDDIALNAEIKYDENYDNKVMDMQFQLNRSMPVNTADIIDYYKNDKINNAMFSYHKTSLFFDFDNMTTNNNIDTSINYVKEECSNYYNEWQSMILEGTDKDITYQIDSTINVAYIDHNIIALDNYYYIFMGETNENRLNIQEVFSLSDSNLITLRDLIEDFNNTDLIDLMRNKILKIGNTKEDYYEFDSITLESSTFRILPNSINFIWQAYDIAPNSTGITEISFSFDELKPFIKAGSPLEYLFL